MPKRFLIYTYHDIPTHGLDAILDYLRPFRAALEARATQQAWYELQQPQRAYATAFEGPKIVYPDIAAEGRFTIDREGAYLGNTAYAIASTDLFLLGVLNSESVLEFYKTISSQIRGGYLRWIYQYVSSIPVPEASAEDRTAVSTLVHRVLNEPLTSTSERVEIEAEINARVARLYGRTR